MEALKKQIEENIIEREKEITDVKKNIEMLEKSKTILVSKQQFLESNMKVKQNAHTSTTRGVSNMDVSKVETQPSTID